MIRKILISLFIFTIVLFGQDNQVIIREEFEDMKNWRPLTFPKIENHTRYSIVSDNENSVLKAESEASASGMILKKSFNVYDYPVVQWKWKVSNVFQKGNAKEKAGDDYPLRIYIVFEYNPQQAGFFEKAKYNTAKLLYGEYPPHSSLNYIWANRQQDRRIIPNAFTAQAQMIVLQEGAGNINKWREEKINILKDYRKAFGEEPPQKAGIAIMSDSDNTGESAEAFVDYIKISR